MVERADISQVLAQMRMIQAQMQRPPQEVSPVRIEAGQFARAQSAAPAFGELFSQAIDSVNAVQQEANRLREGYELGQPGVSLTQVMVAAEKSSIAFEAMTQVRNKLVDAYKEIMNMPV
jgi:flagellar hook-basal body complex protein FliE